MSLFRRTVLAPIIVAIFALPACGGDSGGSAADQAFCGEIKKLDSLDFQSNIGSLASILTDLAKKAPTDELRDALGVITPIFEELNSADPSDPAAMSKILELLSSPEVTAASDVLDKYGTEVCGFQGSSDTTP